MRDESQFIYAAGTTFLTNLSGQAQMDAVNHVYRAKNAVGVLENDLYDSLSSGNNDWTRECVDDLVNHPDAHLASIIKYNHSAPIHKQMMLEEYISISEDMNAEEVAAEQITVIPKRGKSGKDVPCQAPGVKRWIAQHNIARIVKATYNSRSNQFGNRGVQYAIAAAQAVVTRGNESVVTLEIDLYGNLDVSALSSLTGIDRKWIEAAFKTRRKGVTIGATFDSSPPTHLEQFLKELESGLLRDDPGSPVDTLVNHCLSHLRFADSPRQPLVNYNNRFLIAAANTEDRTDAVQRVRDACATLPGGPFEVRETRCCHAIDGFEFLGHNFTTRNGSLSTVESGDAFEEDSWRFSVLEEAVRQSLSSRVSDSGHAESPIEKLATLVAFRKGWAAAYGQCDNVREYLNFFDGPIDELCHACGCSIRQVNGHIRPGMGYFPNALILGD